MVQKLIQTERWKDRLFFEWDHELNYPIKPEDLTSGSTYMAKWRCKEFGHPFNQAIKSRVGRNFNCSTCSGKVLVQGVNDLFTVYPLTKEYFDFEKNEIHEYSPRVTTVVWWKGDPQGCTHEYRQAIQSFVRGLTGCSECSHKRRTEKIRIRLAQEQGSILETHPKYCEIWDYTLNEVSPKKIHSGSAYEAIWTCDLCEESFKQLIYRRLLSPYPRPCCDARTRRSQLQKDVELWIRSNYDEKIEIDTRRVLEDKTELDFYFPFLNRGIEVNGGEGWFHCRKEEFEDQKPEASRELKKRAMCEKQGLDLLMIWESDWLSDKGTEKQRILDFLIK